MVCGNPFALPLGWAESSIEWLNFGMSPARRRLKLYDGTGAQLNEYMPRVVIFQEGVGVDELIRHNYAILPSHWTMEPSGAEVRLPKRNQSAFRQKFDEAKRMVHQCRAHVWVDLSIFFNTQGISIAKRHEYAMSIAKGMLYLIKNRKIKEGDVQGAGEPLPPIAPLREREGRIEISKDEFKESARRWRIDMDKRLMLNRTRSSVSGAGLVRRPPTFAELTINLLLKAYDLGKAEALGNQRNIARSSSAMMEAFTKLYPDADTMKQLALAVPQIIEYWDESMWQSQESDSTRVKLVGGLCKIYQVLVQHAGSSDNCDLDPVPSVQLPSSPETPEQREEAAGAGLVEPDPSLQTPEPREEAAGAGLVEPEPSPQKTSPEPREYEEAPGARLLQVEDVDFVVDVSSDEDDAKINNDSEVINVSDIEDIVSISSDEESA